MAEDTIDKATQVLRKHYRNIPEVAPKSLTHNMQLIGAEKFYPRMAEDLFQLYGDRIDRDVAFHLVSNYGDRAEEIIQLGIRLGKLKRISESVRSEEKNFLGMSASIHPIIEAEVIYSTMYEYACHPEDMLIRRTGLAFVDSRAAIDSVLKVANLMGDVLGWDVEKRNEEYMRALKYIRSMTTIRGDAPVDELVQEFNQSLDKAFSDQKID